MMSIKIWIVMLMSVVGTLIGTQIYRYALNKYQYKSSVFMMALFILFSNLTIGSLYWAEELPMVFYLGSFILVNVFIPYMAVRKAASAQP